MFTRTTGSVPALTGVGLLLMTLVGAPAARQEHVVRTEGGRGGRIIRVTTLAPTGPGSLVEALDARGPRIIVFEVGGVIDLARREIDITEPFLTVAGQTAPSPGITLIRTGLNVMTHDVVLQHLRVRSGAGGADRGSGWEPDALSTQSGAYNVLVEHCSFTWGVDENLSAGGPRFAGATPDEWRRSTSHDVTFRYNIVAEGLARSVHSGGEHSKGSLVHDNATGIHIVGNLYAHNADRNPLFKGGARGWVVNNLIYNPGTRAVHYNLYRGEWEGRDHQSGWIGLVGNVLRAGPSTAPDIALFMAGGDGVVEVFAEDNIAVGRQGQPLPLFGQYYSYPPVYKIASAPLPPGLSPMPASGVPAFVTAQAGARPWDRDEIDRRIVREVIEGRGRIIDSERQVGGYPRHRPTRRSFNEDEWDLTAMVRRDGLLEPLRVVSPD